jgi:hypothetical protein
MPLGLPAKCDMDSKSGASAIVDAVDSFAVRNIVKWSWALKGAAGTAALLLPLMAVAESHLQTGSGAALAATAHLNFKIVIPQVLSIQVGDSGPVAIMSNGRSVALTATARAPSANPAHRGAILNSAARMIIAQDVVCAASAGAGPVLCTASRP